MTLRIGLSSGALFPHVPTEEVPEVAASYGVFELELMLQTHGEYSPAFMAVIECNARAAGSRVNSLHTALLHPVVTPYRRRYDEGRELFQRAIEGAARLGAHAIVWHGATRQEAKEPGAWDRFLAVSSEFAQACSAAGVALAIENVSWCALASVREAAAFAARIPELGPPGSLGFAFDPFQAAESDANLFMMLSAMEGHILDVHLSDYRPGSRHIAPGKGELPWSAVLRGIASTGYDGAMSIEAPLPDREAFVETQDFIEPILRSVLAGGDPLTMEPPLGMREGIRLFNEGQYYEAHEAIEHEWHAERGPIRRLYQGILQIGVGFHHARGNNHRGAVLLLTDGIEKTSAFAPACQGLDLARLITESQAVLDAVIAAGPSGLPSVDLSNLPTIHTTLGVGS